MKSSPSDRRRCRGRWWWLGAALSGVVACGGGTATPPKAADGVTPPATEALRADDGDVVEQLIAVLDAAELDCKPSATDSNAGVCEADFEKVPATNFTFSKPVIFFVSHLSRSDRGSCEKVLPKLNEVNTSVERVKAICFENRLTLTSMLLVPENGLSAADVRQFAETFRNIVQGVQKTDGIADVVTQ